MSTGMPSASSSTPDAAKNSSVGGQQGGRGGLGMVGRPGIAEQKAGMASAVPGAAGS